MVFPPPPPLAGLLGPGLIAQIYSSSEGQATNHRPWSPSQDITAVPLLEFVPMVQDLLAYLALTVQLISSSSPPQRGHVHALGRHSGQFCLALHASDVSLVFITDEHRMVRHLAVQSYCWPFASTVSGLWMLRHQERWAVAESYHDLHSQQLVVCSASHMFLHSSRKHLKKTPISTASTQYLLFLLTLGRLGSGVYYVEITYVGPLLWRQIGEEKDRRQSMHDFPSGSAPRQPRKLFITALSGSPPIFNTLGHH